MLVAKACSLNGTSSLVNRELRRNDIGTVVWNGPQEAIGLPDPIPVLEEARDAAATRLDATDRRQRSRAERKAARDRRRVGDEKELAAQEAAAVDHWCKRRKALGLVVYDVQSSHLFWSLRRFGYNVLLPEFRSAWWQGQWFLTEPQHCPAFRWWRELNRVQRANLLDGKKRQSVDAVPLTNPKLLIDRRHDDGTQWGRLDGVKMGMEAEPSEKYE